MAWVGCVWNRWIYDLSVYIQGVCVSVRVSLFVSMQQSICLSAYRWLCVCVHEFVCGRPMRLFLCLCTGVCVCLFERVPIIQAHFSAFYDFGVFYGFCGFYGFYVSVRVQVSFCLYGVCNPNVTFYTPALQSTSCMHPASRRDGGSWMFVCVPSPYPSHIGAHPV